jgi:hypothetical protein
VSELGDFTMARRNEHGPKTGVDVDSDVDTIDELNQDASVNPLVHFQAIPLQRAF